MTPLDVDEVAVARACSGVRTHLNREECRDAVEWLLAHGRSQRDAAGTLHVPLASLGKWIERDSYPEIHAPRKRYQIDRHVLLAARRTARALRDKPEDTSARREVLRSL